MIVEENSVKLTEIQRVTNYFNHPLINGTFQKFQVLLFSILSFELLHFLKSNIIMNQTLELYIYSHQDTVSSGKKATFNVAIVFSEDNRNNIAELQ